MLRTFYFYIVKHKDLIYKWFKWLTFPIVLIALYYQLVVRVDTKEAITLFIERFTLSNLVYMLIAIGLMPINLSVEALKWKRLLHNTHNLNLKESLQSVFAGISLSIFTPKRVGEYLGRLFLLSKNRQSAVSSLFVSNMSQAIANMFLGLLSVFLFYIQFSMQLSSLKWGVIMAVCLFAGVTLLYFNLTFLVKKIQHWSFFQKHQVYFSAALSYNKETLFELLLLSVMKYIVFILQFVLIIYAFGIRLNLFWGIIAASCVFFVKTILPVPASVELAARGSIAIFFFKYFTDNHIGILVASIVLWIINLGIPAIIGSYYITKKN